MNHLAHASRIDDGFWRTVRLPIDSIGWNSGLLYLQWGYRYHVTIRLPDPGNHEGDIPSTVTRGPFPRDATVLFRRYPEATPWRFDVPYQAEFTLDAIGVDTRPDNPCLTLYMVPDPGGRNPRRILHVHTHDAEHIHCGLPPGETPCPPDVTQSTRHHGGHERLLWVHPSAYDNYRARGGGFKPIGCISRTVHI